VLKIFRTKIRCKTFAQRTTFDTLKVVKDARLAFQVHGRKFYLAPQRRPGGPYYIRFEPPSNGGTRVRTVHRSLRTNVIAAAKARAKLIIEPILNGQWETAEKLKSKSGYATIGDIIERYLSQAEDRPATIRNNISALRLVVRTVLGGDPDAQSSSVLTGNLVRQFEQIRMRDARTEPARSRARASHPELRRASSFTGREAKNAILRRRKSSKSGRVSE